MATVSTGVRTFSDGAQHVKLVDNAISLDAGAQLDAFSRLRVTYPNTIFSSQNLYGTDTDVFEIIASGAGSGQTYLPNESSSNLAVGTVSGEYTIAQTFRYFTYTPGKSQLIVMTGVMGDKVGNVTKRIGYFDDQNGMFFEQTGNYVAVVKRSYVTGSVVDTVVAQADWNLDKLDGTTPSGITLDLSKVTIFIIDFQWLGAGRIRYGFDINGTPRYCHEIVHANLITSVYTTTPTLPLRYEIRNTGTSVGATLKRICCSVVSEGGIIPEGEQYSGSSGITTRAVTTRVPIFAIRMKTTINGKVNRKTVRFLGAHVRASSSDAYLEIIHGHISSGITASWTSAGSDSCVEYSTDISAITFTDEHRVATFFAIAGLGSASQTVEEHADVLNEHDKIYLDYAGTTSTYIVVYGTSFSGTSNLATSLQWLEY